jgi:methionyl-tRNA formyltransferase
MAQVAEKIFFNENLDLKKIICEENRINDDLITFGLIRNIEIVLVANKNELFDTLKECKKEVDFFIMCSFGLKIPVQKFDDINIYNIHYSALPYYKGRHPTFWATVKGEDYIGISIHMVTEEIDEGEIISQRKVPYYFWLDEKDIFKLLTDQIDILLENLNLYLKGQINTIKNVKGYYYKPVTLEDLTINIEKDSYREIFDKVRAQATYKGARLVLDEKERWIKEINFTLQEFNERKYYIEDGKLYVHIKENVWLKSSKFTVDDYN